MGIITFKTTTQFNSINGVFTVEKLAIGTKIEYNNRTYTVVSNTSFIARYYPQTNLLMFKVGFETISTSNRIKSMLNNAGINNVREFNRTYMNSCQSEGKYMFKQLYFCSFENLTIFDS